MALNKVNLVRLKSGEFDPPQEGDVIVYSDSSGQYNHVRVATFADDVAPFIETSALSNDAEFYTPSTVPVLVGRVRGENVTPTSQILDFGAVAYTGEVLQRGEVPGGGGGLPDNEAGGGVFVYNGAYAQHFVSVDDPVTASGKNGDLWFVI